MFGTYQRLPGCMQIYGGMLIGKLVALRVTMSLRAVLCTMLVSEVGDLCEKQGAEMDLDSP